MISKAIIRKFNDNFFGFYKDEDNEFWVLLEQIAYEIPFKVDIDITDVYNWVYQKIKIDDQKFTLISVNSILKAPTIIKNKNFIRWLTKENRMLVNLFYWLQNAEIPAAATTMFLLEDCKKYIAELMGLDVKDIWKK